jgi:hypothetical protein
MTGKVKGFKAEVGEMNPEMRFDHCFLHREAIAAKMLPVPLQSVLDEVVKIVNFVKSRPLNSRLFSVLCQEMGSDHISLLLHTEIRWLSRGVFELHDELRTFLISLSDESWVAKLAYLSDIFYNSNELNREMHGKDETIFSTTDKI